MHVACGIMIDINNHIFMGKRSNLSSDSGKWEFPGGKQEPGESMRQCLHREWKEELNVNIEITELLPITSQTGKYCCHYFTGKITDVANIQLMVHDSIGFFPISEIVRFNIYEEDAQVINYVKRHYIDK